MNFDSLNRAGLNLPSLHLDSAHLSAEAIAACADGALSAAASVRAERHLAGCLECRVAVHEQRSAAAALRTAAAPSLPSGLLERLQALPTTTQLPPSNFTLSPEGHAVFPSYSCRGSRGIDNRASGSNVGDMASNSAGHIHAVDVHEAGIARMRRPRSLVAAAAVMTAGAAGVALGMGGATAVRDAPAPSVPVRVLPVAYRSGTQGTVDQPTQSIDQSTVVSTVVWSSR